MHIGATYNQKYRIYYHRTRYYSIGPQECMYIPVKHCMVGLGIYGVEKSIGLESTITGARQSNQLDVIKSLESSISGAHDVMYIPVKHCMVGLGTYGVEKSIGLESTITGARQSNQLDAIKSRDQQSLGLMT